MARAQHTRNKRALFADVEQKCSNGRGTPEEIYADYDSFEEDSDDSWDDCCKDRAPPYPCENRDLPAPPSQQQQQQTIYGLVPLVKRAGNRMRKRWSLGSLGLIRKFGSNLTATTTTDFGKLLSPRTFFTLS